MISLSTIKTAGVAGMLLAVAASASAQESFYDYETIITTTERVEKIELASAGWGDPSFRVEKSRAGYCYIEENSQRAIDHIRAGLDQGWDFRTEEDIVLEDSTCFAPFLEVAAKPKYQEDTFGVYSKEYDFASFRYYVVRYFASCAWERDTALFTAELDGVTNPDGIWPYIRNRYSPDTFAEAADTCLPGFAELEQRDLLFAHDFVQQMTNRRELDE